MNGNQDDLVRRLREGGSDAGTPAPLRAIRARGDVLRRRRRAATLAAVAAAAVVVIGVAASATGGMLRSEPAPAGRPEPTVMRTQKGPPPTPPPPGPTVDDCVRDARSDPPAPGADEVLVFFGCFGEGRPELTVARLREVGAGGSVSDQLRTAMLAYLAGPTRAERRAGDGSIFGPDAQGILDDVDVDEAGRAVIDLDLAAAGYTSTASAQSMAIWDQLSAIAFQFDEVTVLEPRFDGSCEAFGVALQAGVCTVVGRDGSQVEGP